MNDSSTVFIVDDDAAVRDALTHLLEAAGYRAEAYASGAEYLEACAPERPGCLVLDIQMPDLNGLTLQAMLAQRGHSQPIIFLTGHGTVPEAVRALKGGAFDFLEKPVEGGALLARIAEALQVDTDRRHQAAAREALKARCAELTERERELLPLVAAGRSSKEIARQLNISHRTVEVHRASIMHKTGAHTVVELAAIAEACGISDSHNLIMECGKPHRS